MWRANSFEIPLGVSYSKSYGLGRGTGAIVQRGPTPVEVGKEYELEVTEISNQGDGISRVHGFVVFVKEGTVGQKRKVKIDQIGSSFAIGTVVS
jgi:predicted RNA-binding protein with TRAM domain